MRPKLSIITPCSRPKNLPLMEPSIDAVADYFDTTWLIAYDGLRVKEKDLGYLPDTGKNWELYKAVVSKPGSAVGNAQNNHCLECIPSDNWVLFLSDDNVVHPDYGSRLSDAIEMLPDKRAFIYQQQVGSWVRGCGPATMHIGQIDLAQFTLHRSLIGARRLDHTKYEADGILIEALYQEYPDLFTFLPVTACYYNKLRT